MSNIIAISPTGKEIVVENLIPQSKVKEQLNYWLNMGMSNCKYYTKPAQYIKREL